MFLLPEKARKIGRDGIQQINQFSARLFLNDILEVVSKRFELAFADSFSQPRPEQLLLAVVEVDPALVINQSADFFEIRVG
jgi:hypothetical protein